MGESVLLAALSGLGGALISGLASWAYMASTMVKRSDVDKMIGKEVSHIETKIQSQLEFVISALSDIKNRLNRLEDHYRGTHV